MSGIYIPGMEMPANCHDCNCFIRDSDGSDYCCLLMRDIEDNYKRDDDCPLVHVPKHGDLIDMDALITKFCEWGTCLERGRKLVITMCEAKQAIVDIIEDAPTIIPAEEGEE